MIFIVNGAGNTNLLFSTTQTPAGISQRAQINVRLRQAVVGGARPRRIGSTASGAYKLTALTGVETDRVMKLDSEFLNYPDEFGQPIIQLLRIDGNTPEEQRVFMSSVLAHEVAHTLGLQEIYTNFYGDVEESHGGKSKINCFMRGWASKNWEIFQEDILLCPYCAEKLEGEIADRDLYED